MEASVDPQPRGPDWMPITPKTGSLLHADSQASCRTAAQEGFTGRVAIHPDQVAPINEAFAPSREDVELARKIVVAFEKDGGAGTVGIDGKMFDIPHLKRARNVLALHEQYQRHE
jgi:citrate lyase subunit beta/citryl-CoA lyase